MTDELKPIRCRCGGEAHHVSASCWNHRVICKNCGTQTKVFYTAIEAIEVWNRAMSAKDINVPNKFATDINVEKKIAKVVRKTKTYNLPTTIPHVIDTRKEWWDECENCSTTVEPSDRYCSHCGAKLDWSGNE